MPKNLPRGLRNNNPGNIDYNPRNKWQGQVGIETDLPSSIKPRFAKFKDMIYGIRAMACLLIAYFDRHDCDTVRKVLNRWAPSTENNTKAYVNAVAAKVGVGKDERVDLHEYKILRSLIVAIIEHENGMTLEEAGISDDQVAKALVMAGVRETTKPLVKSKTIAGATTAGAATALPLVAEVHDIVNQTKDQVEPLVWYSDSLRIVFLVLALAGLGLVVYAKLKERKRGIS